MTKARGKANPAVPAGVPPGAPTEPPARRGRGRPKGTRRDVIMREAARLFYERGYHATMIDEIGEAAGITGPAVYRHFKSKDELLVALIDESADRAAAGIQTVHELGGPPVQMLERLVRSQVRVAIEGAPLLTVLSGHELRDLPPTERSRLIKRDRQNREEWMHLLSAARPELDEPEVRAMVIGAIELMRALATQAELDPDRLEQLAFKMVFAAIGLRARGQN